MSILLSQHKNSQINDLISGNISAIEISNVLSKSACVSLLCEKITKRNSISSGPGLTAKLEPLLVHTSMTKQVISQMPITQTNLFKSYSQTPYLL